MKPDQIAILKDKLQGWPDAMCLTSKDVADLLSLLDEKAEQIKAGEDKAVKLTGGLTTAPVAETSPGLPDDERALAVIDDTFKYLKPDGPSRKAAVYLRSRLAKPAPPADDIFIAHIQSHLKPGQEVVCKICGKSAKEIIHEIS